MSTTRYQDVEVTIVGLTFIVDYRYTEELSADDLNPAESAEVEIINVLVKGQPEADADELLEAICTNVFSTPKNGFTLLEEAILKSHQQ